MIARAMAMVRFASPRGPQPERHEEDDERDDHQRRVECRPGARRAVGVGVVGGAGHGRPEHEQDRGGDRDVGRSVLADDVEDDGEQERADREVGHRPMDGMAEPGAVEEVLDRPDRSEEGAQPAMVEVTERPRPAILRSDQSSEQTSHGTTSRTSVSTDRPHRSQVRG